MQSKSILTQLLDNVEKVFNSVRYNGFYIALSLLFPYIIFKLDAGKELVLSLMEDHAYLNLVLSVVSFSILGFSIWCIPVLGIELFVKIFPSFGKDRPYKICLLEQLTDIYNGISRKQLSETSETGERKKAALIITSSQVPIRYLAILPWILFILTTLKASFDSNVLVMVCLVILIPILIALRHYPKLLVTFFDLILHADHRAEKKKRYLIFLASLLLIPFLFYLIFLVAKPDTHALKYWLSGMNFLGLIFFYSYLLYTEKSKHHQTDSQTGYFRSKFNHSLLIIYLIIAIIIFYTLNQRQLIQYISPVVVITTMSSALIIFFELVFTSQFLLIGLITDNKCSISEKDVLPAASMKSSLTWLKAYKYTLIFLVLWVVKLYFFSSSNTHAIRKYATKAYNYTDTSRLELTKYFDKWLNTNCAVKKDSTIYLISGQGGGSRAAAWFYMNMAKMETLDSTFYQHVFSLSTISGSSSGADMYLAAKHYGVIFNKDSIEEQGKKLYGINYMSSAFFGLLLGDAIESVFDKFDDFPRDRNYHLQEEERRAFQQAFHPTDSSFFNNDYLSSYARDSCLPPLFLINTAIVNFGTRGVFSPVKMSSFSFARDLYAEFKKENCNSGFDLPMVTCVCQSEAFPILSAYNYMDCVGRFVDGGLYDNSGCTTTLEVYEALRRYCDVSGRQYLRFICINIINGSIDEDVIAPYQNASILNTVTAAYQSPFSGHRAFAYKNLQREIKYLCPSDTVVDIKLDPSITLTRTLSAKSVGDMYKNIDADSNSRTNTFLKPLRKKQ
ncbi:MAG: hypothetical protein QM802_22935 [Agriterribacter sp.]